MAQKNSPGKKVKESSSEQFVFGSSNYCLMLAGIVVVAFGFTLMMGQTEIYDFRKIVLAPLVVLLGFALGFFAILKKQSPK